MSKRFNNLQIELTPKRYSEDQYQTYRLIKSLYDKGLGYRQIAIFLNGRDIRTHKGKEWGSNYVLSVLKRYKEREERLKLRNTQYKPIRSPMWIEFTK